MPIRANITQLPNNGGTALTDIEAQNDGGAAYSLGGTTVGVYDTTATVGQEVRIRAVNGVGPGPWSNAKIISAGAPELLLNPTFADSSVWAGTDGTTAFSISGGNLTITNRGPDFDHGVFQNIAFVIGTYDIVVVLNSATGTGARVKVGFPGGADISGLTPLSTPGTYSGVYVSPSAATRAFILSTASPSSTAVWASASLKLRA
jgi:hypothetical protein